MSLYTELAEVHPKLKRGIVWCHKCGNTQTVDTAKCFKLGWPKCCNETMSIDNPQERKQLSHE